MGPNITLRCCPNLAAKPDHQPEVSELRVVTQFEQDVVALHVAMEDVEAVVVHDSGEEVFDEVAGLGLGGRAVGDEVKDGAAITKIEDKVDRPKF
ncbi:hypothetical protein NL676_007725 [Syzygium grande]|nr:hypothetical protein NL676_007725 [Syzygium grande]